MYYHLQTNAETGKPLFLRSYAYNPATGGKYAEFTNSRALAGLFSALDVSILRGPHGLASLVGPVNLLITKHDSGQPVASIILE